MKMVSEENRIELLQTLFYFAKRVANDKAATPAELAALPEIAKILFTTSV